MVTASESLYQVVENTAKRIFEDTLWHNGRSAKELYDARYRLQRDEQKVAPEFRVAYVDGPDDVELGDLLVIFEIPKSESRYGNRKYVNDWLTEREICMSGPGRGGSVSYGRVVAKSKSFITVNDLFKPGYGFGVDLTIMTVPSFNVTQTKIKGSGQYREVGNLGNMDNFLRRMAKHSEFAAWQTLYKQAMQQRDVLAGKAEKDREEASAALQVKREKVARLNEIIGDELLTLDVFAGARGEVRLPKWFTLARLRTYLMGVGYEKGLSVGVGLEIEQLLKDLGLTEN